MSARRILVAGIGNIFLGDDAWGCEVAQRLMRRPQPDGVTVDDYGIRGFDLAYAMMEDVDLTIMIDALPRGKTPGTLVVLEPDLDALEAEGEVEVETHAMNPVNVLHLVQSLGGKPGNVLVVGCEPDLATLDEEGMMGLSAPVQASIDEAVRMVESLIAEALAEEEGSEAVAAASGPPGERGAKHAEGE